MDKVLIITAHLIYAGKTRSLSSAVAAVDAPVPAILRAGHPLPQGDHFRWARQVGGQDGGQGGAGVAQVVKEPLESLVGG